MRLDVTAHGLKIVAENVQDVGYLKHLGYMNPDPDLLLKVTVMRTSESFGEGALIEIEWEDARCDHKAAGEVIQHISGPINPPYQTKSYGDECCDKKMDGSKADYSDIGYNISSTSLDYPEEKKSRKKH